MNTLAGDSRALLRLPVSGPVVVWLSPASPVVSPSDVLTATVRRQPRIPERRLAAYTCGEGKLRLRYRIAQSREAVELKTDSWLTWHDRVEALVGCNCTRIETLG